MLKLYCISPALSMQFRTNVPYYEARGVERLLHPFDGPGTRRPKTLLTGALRSLGDGPPTGGPSNPPDQRALFNPSVSRQLFG
jgi:hypothetical protein